MKKRRSGVMIQSSYPPGSTHFQRRLQRQTYIPAVILNGSQATRQFPMFNDKPTIKARALYLGDRLNLRAFEATHRLGSNPLTVSAGQYGCAVLFRYGVIVLFDLTAVEEAEFRRSIESYVFEPNEKPEFEELDIRSAPNGSRVLSTVFCSCANPTLNACRWWPRFLLVVWSWRNMSRAWRALLTGWSRWPPD